MINILVTGGLGGVALILRDKISTKNYIDKYFIFLSKKDLPIDDETKLRFFFNSHKIDICINCAAYTNVNEAEFNPELAYASNSLGVGMLAAQCYLHNILFIHLSTNYIFDGKFQQPYNESDISQAINVYGASKRDGELTIINSTERYFIIRTSWLFSKLGNSLIKTVCEYSAAKKVLNIVKDQYGSSTYT